MARKNLALNAFAWTVSITSLFVTLLCVGLVSLIVGDWIVIKTGNQVFGWGLGFFIFFGFLCALGAAIGAWIWLRGPTSYASEDPDTLTRILAEISSAERE